jgi:hypothetical protein
MMTLLVTGRVRDRMKLLRACFGGLYLARPLPLFPCSTSSLQGGEEAPLPLLLIAMMFCPSTWGQATLD